MTPVNFPLKQARFLTRYLQGQMVVLPLIPSLRACPSKVLSSMKQSGWEYELYWGRHISERCIQLQNDIRDKQCSLRRFPLDTESWREAVAMPARCTGLWLAGSSAREDLSTNGRSWPPPMRSAQRLGLGYLDIGGPVSCKYKCAK